MLLVALAKKLRPLPSSPHLAKAFVYFTSMKSHFSQIGRRPFRADILLATSSLLAWFLLDNLQADINLTPAGLVIETPWWQPHWSPGPWMLAIFGLALACWRQHYQVLEAPAEAALTKRLRRLPLFVCTLITLRLLSLWNPLEILFPYLALLWAPHASWALGLLVPLLLHIPTGRAAEKAASPHRGAALIFLSCLLGYSIYTLYFCQLTMLHGDEGQYLRVTQSLIHDGDMDLANNLATDFTNEFHSSPFDVHQAPSSPPGKVYSGHPIGLSALLLPAYLTGLELWQNPRLGAALFMALLAAACAALFFIWLVRLGIERFAAWCSVGIAATTAPFFLYANQFYPEVPALLIALLNLVILAHWQRPGGTYRSLGRWEPLLLGFLVILLGALLFLHPRYIALAAIPGFLILLQAWHSPQRRRALFVLGLSTMACLGGLLAYHDVLTGDWLGHFRPGAAWDREALQIGTWQYSLGGHWLHQKVGLLSSAPIFLLVPIGWYVLARQRDRRFFLVLALYIATAAVHGLHPDWQFGFCYPVRFLVTALPALLCGLAMALPALAGRATALFLLAMTLTISLETTLATIALPESGFRGENLVSRTINDYYPFAVHFTPPDQTTPPFQDLLFWGLLLSLLLLQSKPPFSSRRLLQGFMILIAALIPVLWNQTQTIAARLKKDAQIYLKSTRNSTILHSPAYPLDLSQHISFHKRLDLANPWYSNAAKSENKKIAVAGENSAGMLVSARLPVLRTGFYALSMPDLSAVPAELQKKAPGQLIVSLRNTLPTTSRWEERLSQPITTPGKKADRTIVGFYMDRRRIGYLDLEYLGSGTLSISGGLLVPLVNTALGRSTFISRLSQRQLEVNAPTASAKNIATGAFYSGLDNGYYSVHFEVGGSVVKSLFERNPEPVRMAIFTAPPGSGADAFNTPLTHWFLSDMQYGVDTPRPLVESIQAPWWEILPYGDRAFKLFFSLPEPRDVFFLIKYAGRENLHLETLELHGEKVETANEEKRPARRQDGTLTPLSPQVMLADLSNRYMQILASCIARNDFSALYKIFARSRQKQTTAADLAAHFQAFLQYGDKLAATGKLKPAFNPAPYIDAKGILVLEGSYPTQPPVNFKFFCIRENSTWALVGLTLNTQ